MNPTTIAQTKTERTQKIEGWSNPCIPAPIAKGKATIRLHHAMSPTCWWSWGYYGTLSRVRLVYGDQVDLNLAILPVYEDIEHYWHQYDLSPERMKKWVEDSQAKMGVPIYTGYAKATMPKSVVRHALAVVAAYRQGQPQGDRMCRALARRFCVEGNMSDSDETLVEAARESDLDVERFRRDWRDQAKLGRELEEQTHGLPHVPLGYYNLVLEDNKGRKVVLDYAFEPDDVVSAIEYLSGGKLKKNAPTDPVAYLRAAGPAPAAEIARAFAWTPAKAEEALKSLEKEGQLRRLTLAGAPHWAAA